MKFVDQFPANLKTAKMTKFVAHAYKSHLTDPPEPWFFLKDMDGYGVMRPVILQGREGYRYECYTTSKIGVDYRHLVIRDRELVTLMYNPNFLILAGVELRFSCPASPWHIEVTFPHKEPK